MNDDSCTCRNRVLTKREMVYWARPDRTGFVTARDCPLHGVVIVDGPIIHPAQDVNHPDAESEKSAKKA